MRSAAPDQNRSQSRITATLRAKVNSPGGFLDPATVTGYAKLNRRRYRMRSLIFATILAVSPMAVAPTASFADIGDCGPEAPCEIGTDEVTGGSYHLIYPEGWDGVTALPVLVFFHGHNSNGATVFRSGGLKTDFADHGYLIVAPNGPRISNGNARAWPARPVTGGRRDDVAFVLKVLDDVATRVPVDPASIYASGFSAGGSMAWMMACYAANRFDGIASVAGALRRPNPEGVCPSGPVRLIQIHGFSDTQVPFEGRGINDWHQGDLFQSFDLLRATNKCRSNPDRIEIGEVFSCREWSDSCESGAAKMCIHDGGHGLPQGWTALARTFFEDK
jgi:polyhydroxybutyrate depolymerase